MSNEIERKDDPFFIYGRVSIDEWDWKEGGKHIAKKLMKTPEAYILFDSGKLMGMFSALAQQKKQLEAEREKVADLEANVRELEEMLERERKQALYMVKSLEAENADLTARLKGVRECYKGRKEFFSGEVPPPEAVYHYPLVRDMWNAIKKACEEGK